MNKNCGYSPYNDRIKPEDGRIFENPWLVLLRHPEEQEWFCQGTLITDRYVLTTAICSEAIVANETIIILGEYDRTVDYDCETPNVCSAGSIIERVPHNVIVHPDFQNDTYENDIALIMLNRKISYSNRVFPDKLHMDSSTTINKQCGETPYSIRERPPSGRMYENPWLVLLRHPEETLHFCHGTLISNRYVLTTAICAIAVVTNVNATAEQQATEIILGEHDLSTETDCITAWNCSLPTTKRSVENVVVHENFTSKIYANDIALLYMNASIQFDNS
uniref:Peptidase S1 domain-containing protein n=1 Tax=Anopheles culicifacies TaxID=139723 RepID=A0A182MQF4_9DIPT